MLLYQYLEVKDFISLIFLSLYNLKMLRYIYLFQESEYDRKEHVTFSKQIVFLSGEGKRPTLKKRKRNSEIKA